MTDSGLADAEEADANIEKPAPRIHATSPRPARRSSSIALSKTGRAMDDAQ